MCHIIGAYSIWAGATLGVQVRGRSDTRPTPLPKWVTEQLSAAVTLLDDPISDAAYADGGVYTLAEVAASSRSVVLYSEVSQEGDERCRSVSCSRPYLG